MKLTSLIFAIIILLLWLASATYIAAPDNVQSMLPQPPMGNIPHAFLGVAIFLLSFIVIIVWAALTPDNPTPKPVTPPPTPAK